MFLWNIGNRKTVLVKKRLGTYFLHIICPINCVCRVNQLAWVFILLIHITRPQSFKKLSQWSCCFSVKSVSSAQIVSKFNKKINQLFLRSWYLSMASPICFLAAKFMQLFLILWSLEMAEHCGTSGLGDLSKKRLTRWPSRRFGSTPRRMWMGALDATNMSTMLFIFLSFRLTSDSMSLSSLMSGIMSSTFFRAVGKVFCF